MIGLRIFASHLKGKTSLTKPNNMISKAQSPRLKICNTRWMGNIMNVGRKLNMMTTGPLTFFQGRYPSVSKRRLAKPGTLPAVQGYQSNPLQMSRYSTNRPQL